MDEEKKVVISQEEYDALRQAKAEAEKPQKVTNNLYDRLDIPVKVLDYVIIFGILGIVLAIVIGVVAY